MEEGILRTAFTNQTKFFYPKSRLPNEKARLFRTNQKKVTSHPTLTKDFPKVTKLKLPVQPIWIQSTIWPTICWKKRISSQKIRSHLKVIFTRRPSTHDWWPLSPTDNRGSVHGDTRTNNEIIVNAVSSLSV